MFCSKHNSHITHISIHHNHYRFHWDHVTSGYILHSASLAHHRVSRLSRRHKYGWPSSRELIYAALLQIFWTRLTPCFSNLQCLKWLLLLAFGSLASLIMAAMLKDMHNLYSAEVTFTKSANLLGYWSKDALFPIDHNTFHFHQWVW